MVRHHVENWIFKWKIKRRSDFNEEMPLQFIGSNVFETTRPLGVVEFYDESLELIDTGVFDDDRYFDVFVEYAQAAPGDVLMRVTAHNRGDRAARLDLLPQLTLRQ